MAAHRPVLLKPALEGLALRKDGFYVDGTFGRGGHARELLAALGPEGRLLAFDKDPQAIESAEALAREDDRFRIVHGSFTMLEQVVTAEGKTGAVDGVLLDLGVSSPQLDDGERGFSFRFGGPLDMRMDTSRGESAADWLATAEQEEISLVIRDYGEERFHHRIARAICEAREEAPIETTSQLVGIIEAAVPTREKKKHPATRAFQAIRIHINKELDDLTEVLEQTERVLAAGGRLSVISFHSLEDRQVKRFMRDRSRPAPPPKGLPRGLPVAEETPPFRLVGKAQRASTEELAENPRARSAVLRIAERVR
ncbi:MAG: 16S rRNA (cytosine(1402)-N(4))-methyltransferase RsmH [Gammaproteobacteria bacterium]|nr:16S rRNA (cytosine(1402)-N(4))-methyltransferase RsmH [Gammaproteobacteria bacterium]